MTSSFSGVFFGLVSILPVFIIFCSSETIFIVSLSMIFCLCIYFSDTRKTSYERSYSPGGREQLRDDDTIINKVIICEVSGKPFRIIKQELAFYRKHNLLLPKKHPDVRHAERLAKRPGRTLYLRECDKCGKEMVSVYGKKENLEVLESLEKDNQQKQKVYCEECYKREVYG